MSERVSPDQDKVIDNIISTLRVIGHRMNIGQGHEDTVYQLYETYFHFRPELAEESYKTIGILSMLGVEVAMGLGIDDATSDELYGQALDRA